MTEIRPTDAPVLVAYATRHGSTAEIAERIATAMRDSGCDARAIPADDVRDLSCYRAVIIGSALYMRRIEGAARHFVRRHRRALQRMPVWLFTSGPVDVGGEHHEPDEPESAVAMARRLGARGHVIFGGRLPMEPHSFIERAMVAKTPPELRDARDWDAIESWARSVADQLAPTPVGM